MPFQRRLCCASLGVLLCLCTSTAWSASSTFPGNVGSGVIPDSPAASLVVPFAVSGLARDVRTVELRLQLAHTWAGDIDAVLTSPDGRARMVVFSRVGAGTLPLGDNSNFAGDYRFADSAGDASLWAAAAAAPTTGDDIAPGTYRATSAGAPLTSDNGGCPTSLTGVFGGLTPAQANGTWTLVLRDRSIDDTGTISLAELTIIDADPGVFADGFEAASDPRPDAARGNTPASHCINKVVADFTGDGLTDYALARPAGGEILWIVRENLGAGTAVAEQDATVFLLGRTSDFIDTIDYDGDRIADATVWNASTGAVQVRRSSRSIDPVVSIAFGQAGDNVLQSGDYDGDLRDDLALFRKPAIDEPPGPMHIVIRDSATGGIRSITVDDGTNGDVYAASGFDMNGDGVADISLQDADPANPAVARFRLVNGRTGSLFAQFELGTIDHYIVPGNHTGDPRFDTTVRRTADGLRYHTMRDSLTGQVTLTEVQFGIAGDTSLGGDYDGDGLTDYAVWRFDTTPGQSRFLVRSSIDPATVWTIFGGIGSDPPDFPVAGARVQ